MSGAVKPLRLRDFLGQPELGKGLLDWAEKRRLRKRQKLLAREGDVLRLTRSAVDLARQETGGAYQLDIDEAKAAISTWKAMLTASAARRLSSLFT